jgi:disulfide bond formation protein DsbB
MTANYRDDYMLKTSRSLFTLSFLICLLAMAFALYLQLSLGQDPCPLCILQRIAVILLGVISLIALIHHPKPLGIRIYASLGLLSSLFGLATAARQVYLQSLPPDQTPACGPGLNYLFHVLPVDQAIMIVLKGTGDCAKVDWRFLHLSLAGWSAILFLGLSLLLIWIWIKPRNTN